MTESRLSVEPIEAVVDSMLCKQFAVGGHGPHSYYCVGLVCELAKRCAGIDLQDPFVDPVPTETRVAQFREQFIILPSMADLQPLDVLFSHQDGYAHLSIVENSRWAVSINIGEGVIRVPLAEEIQRAISAHRLKSLLS